MPRPHVNRHTCLCPSAKVQPGLHRVQLCRGLQEKCHLLAQAPLLLHWLCPVKLCWELQESCHLLLLQQQCLA